MPNGLSLTEQFTLGNDSIMKVLSEYYHFSVQNKQFQANKQNKTNQKKEKKLNSTQNIQFEHEKPANFHIKDRSMK